MTKGHSFHIPVMGIGYTIDAPLKVAHLGIDSVISLVDDILLEKLRKMYSSRYGFTYSEIDEKTEDYRARRVTAYLNVVHDIVQEKFEELKNSISEKQQEIKRYFSILPDYSTLKQKFITFSKDLDSKDFTNWFKDNLTFGSIDVNIMTKVDGINYFSGKQLPVEFNDAHAALRGFANSKLNSSLVLSAGMNARLYSYMEQFPDFYPDVNGQLKKKIILKVSDFRSALIQGKFLARKGLWVSEFRVESGLNCGGHAFPTDGYLLGPILGEFRDKRVQLIQILYDNIIIALKNKNLPVPEKPLQMKITAQGGVGTSAEHEFLLKHYELDSVGWGTPFLLVPEVTNVDEITLQKLIDAKDDDLYLSSISPLGVSFNSLRGNTKDIERHSYIDNGRPGSPCPKKYVSFNNEFTEEGICTASRLYQFYKLKELDTKELPRSEHQQEFDKIVEKSCICVGLGTSALLVNNLDTKVEGKGVSVCPGPNMSYFSKVMTLNEIIDHIYGRVNVMTVKDRPHIFLKEISLYINFLKNKIAESKSFFTDADKKYFSNFINNLKEGIFYYQDQVPELKEQFPGEDNFVSELNNYKELLFTLDHQVNRT